VKQNLVKMLLLALWVFGVLVLLGLMAGKALAQETVTPTPEDTPLFGDDDPFEVETGECDPNIEGVKADHDLQYQYFCGHCFPEPERLIPTGTPWPTAPVSCPDDDGDGTCNVSDPDYCPDDDGDGICNWEDPDNCYDENGDGICETTPTPGGPLPTSQVTPGPTATPLPQYWLSYLGQSSFDGINYTYYAQANLPAVAPAGYLMHIVGGTTGDGYMAFKGVGTQTTNFVVYGYGQVADIWACVGMSFTFPNPCEQFTIDQHYGGVGWHAPSDPIIFWIGGPSQHRLFGTIDIYAIYEDIHITPTPEATSTPAATATATMEPGICNNASTYYNGEGGGAFGVDEDEGFLPGLYIRDGVCVTVFPEKSIILSAAETLGLIDYWTGLQFCTRYVGIEDFSLFGITFNILHYLAAGGAIGLVRRYLR